MTTVKKIIIIILIIVVAVLIYMVTIGKRNTAVAPTENTKAGEKQEVKNETGEKEEIKIPTVANEEKKDLSAVQGKVSKIDIGSVTIIAEGDIEETFSIPTENVQFFKEVKKDESFMMEEIGLLDIKEGDDVEILINAEKKELSFLKVLSE